MIKWIIASIIFFAIVLELVLFAPERGDRDPGLQSQAQSELKKESQKDIEQVLSGTHLIESQGEKKLWELEAAQARKKKRSPDWRLDEVRVQFYGENAVHYNASGKQGFVGENQKQLRIEGDTEIRSSNGYVLNTEVIYYLTKSRAIDGPQKVELRGPLEPDNGGPLFMQSDRFDANLNSNLINMRDNVNGRKTLRDGRKMTIRSQEAQFSGQSQYALFKKNVIIDVDSMTVTGPRAKFIYKNNELDSAFVDGGVKIKDVGKWGVAGEAHVFFKENKFVFRGDPKVVQGEDQLIGDEIIVYDGGDRIQVLKAKTKYRTKEEGEQSLEPVGRKRNP